MPGLSFFDDGIQLTSVLALEQLLIAPRDRCQHCIVGDQAERQNAKHSQHAALRSRFIALSGQKYHRIDAREEEYSRGSSNKGIHALVQLPRALGRDDLLPRLMYLTTKVQVVGIGERREADSKVFLVGSSEGMNSR
jgi:hypothetical protein